MNSNDRPTNSKNDDGEEEEEFVLYVILNCNFEAFCFPRILTYEKEIHVIQLFGKVQYKGKMYLFLSAAALLRVLVYVEFFNNWAASWSGK